MSPNSGIILRNLIGYLLGRLKHVTWTRIQHATVAPIPVIGPDTCPLKFVTLTRIQHGTVVPLPGTIQDIWSLKYDIHEQWLEHIARNVWRRRWRHDRNLGLKHAT
jgi:hypothetical protein